MNFASIKFWFNVGAFEPVKVHNRNSHTWDNPQLSYTLTRNIEDVKKKFIGLQTHNDVADLLEIPTGQLLHILYSNTSKYNSFPVKKKSGQERVIDAPNASIKILQNKLKPLIEAHYRVKKPVHGFVGEGKGIISNATQHRKKSYVLNIDLKDFFHSVHFGRVQGIFRNTPFNMGIKAASVLAHLCTHNQRLPQGASTSPVLSNLASTNLDKKLVQIAKKFHLTYTRYADDLTFSSNKPFSKLIVEQETTEEGDERHRVGKILEQAIQDSGFQVNHNKTRLQHKSQRQEVTGLVVNEGVNVNRKFIRKTRAMIKEWDRDLLAAEKRFLKQRYHYDDKQLSNMKLTGQTYKNAIYGNLSFIKMVKGEEHSPYLTLCKKVLKLDNNPPKFVNKLKDVFEMFDVFICHASENKQEVALPLNSELEKHNLKTFVDCFEISWGDSLVSKINTALRKSKYVIAIISEESINKDWPMKELNAVLSAEIGTKETKLLPLMVGDSEALLDQLPLLRDKYYLEYSSDNLIRIAEEVNKLLSKHSD